MFGILFEKLKLKTFYHVTPVDNVDLIKKEGLRPGSFVTSSLEDAEGMRDYIADYDKIQATIMELDLTPEQVDKLTVDELQPNSYETHDVIPVENLNW